MSVTLAAVPRPHPKLNHRLSGCLASSLSTSSSMKAKNIQFSPPHPHAHGYHRRRLASPISPLSTLYNTRSLNRTKEEVIAVCDREVQWSFELEYGRTIEKYMKESEVGPLFYFTHA